MKPSHPIRWLALLVCVWPTPAAAQTPQPRTVEEIKIRQIANQDDATVNRYLGQPAKCERQGARVKCHYKGGAVEVVFRDAKADWVTVYPFNHRFSLSAVEPYGLPKDRKPTEAGPRQIRWANIDGFVSVVVQAQPGGTVDYIRAQVKTP